MSPYRISRLICRATLIAAFLSPICLSARTVTDANKVVYDVLDETAKTVRVSKINNTIFNNLSADITIPAEVMNAATTSGSNDGPYYVVAIDANAFANCAPITSVTITAPVSRIEEKTFIGCKSLTSVTFPTTVNFIGDNVFQDCTSLTSIGDMASITFIGSYAFYNCSSLPTIDLPEGLTELKYNAFENCSSLDNITIPTTLSMIQYQTFKNCKGLETLNFAGDGCSTILGYAFDGCSSLVAPTFPQSVNHIYEHSFWELRQSGHSETQCFDESGKHCISGEWHFKN